MAYRILAILALLTFSLASTGSRAEVWTVTSEERFPPYNFSQDGKRAGMDTEIVEAVLARMGVTASHVAVPWNRVVASLDQNETDLAFQFVGTPERIEKYAMIGPFRTGRTVFVVRADSPLSYNSLEDLRGHTVGTVNGFSYTPEFDAATFIVREPATTSLIALNKLLAGRSDAVIGDLYTLVHLARQAGFSDKLNHYQLKLVGLCLGWKP
ncbi:MAG: transporter substrate-binding domain-containing protein, partial [Rhodospirillaceae bacterium]